MSSSQDIQLAINRIYRILSSKRASGYRDIRLGLDRIRRVVPDKQDWKGVHVAGTNGKGSICAFLAGLFKLGGIGYGSYTSPAFPERHNAVTINGLYVNPRMYEMEMRHVQARWNRIADGWKFRHGEEPEALSPFELETATAFRAFNKMHVPYGIVEVGMGGATDATNAMKEKSVAIISKIGLDHQEYLGNSIENIARVKAGIMQRGVPCIVDHTNPPSVVRVLREHARQIGTELILTWKAEPLLMTLDNEKWKLESYQIQNLLCAALAFRHLFPHKEINLDKLMATEPFLPGRMEKVQIKLKDYGPSRRVLVDGAHNMLGIEGLVSHTEKHIRKENQPVTWIMGMSSSKHKPFADMIEKVLRPGDNFAFVEYAPGPNEPPPAPANFGLDHAKTIVSNHDQLYDGEPDIGSALTWAFNKAVENSPIVVTGSLYLIRDLFSLNGVQRKRQLKTRRPGRSQLYRYVQLAQQRRLTEEEKREFKQARRHWHLSPVRNGTFAKVREGGEPTPPPIPEEVSELQRTAAYHRKQEEGYQKVITSIQNDVEKQDNEDREEPGERVAKLAAQVKDLEKVAVNHREGYDAAMLKIRGHSALPHKKYMGYRRIFGRPKKQKAATRSPYAQAQSPEDVEAASDAQPVIDWEIDAIAEGVDGDRRTRRLRKRMVEEKEKEDKEKSDPFAERLTSERR